MAEKQVDRDAEIDAWARYQERVHNLTAVQQAQADRVRREISVGSERIAAWLCETRELVDHMGS